MTTATHPVAPEEIMAWLDGELDGNASHSVDAHVAECASCAALTGEFKRTSQHLSQWTTPEVSTRIDEAVRQTLAQIEKRNGGTPRGATTPSFSYWKRRTNAGIMAATAVALVGILYLSTSGIRQVRKTQMAGPPLGMAATVRTEQSDAMTSAPVDAPSAPPPPARQVAEMQNGPLSTRSYSPPTSPAAPMIARSVAITIQVKDCSTARTSLDAIVAKYNGYSANLTVENPENGSRRLQTSLRIPAGQITSALNEFKNLGRTLVETQSGEEVTQQHADLVARLQNAVETEGRRRAILQQRTGKIEDVLQVEEEIARVRGEIESMEADQKVLEHRVAFGTIDLQLVEEFKEQFNPSPISTSGELRNAFIQGMRHASGTILGLILFLEEFGPAMLIWAAIIGIPVYFAWRRYQRVRARF